MCHYLYAAEKALPGSFKLSAAPEMSHEHGADF